MDVVKPPEPLHLSGNIRKNWLVFKQKLQLFITATEPEKPRPSAVKAAILLSTAGDEALDVYNNFSFAAGENREDYDTLVRKFEEYCVDQGNEVYERHIFRLRTQEDSEPFERFLRDLKKQAKLCNFGSLEESMIRDQVVFGTNNAKLREKLLSDKDLNLQKAEEICKAAELSALQSAAWSKESLHVDFTNRTNRTKFANATRCRNCNKVHAPERCPAYGKTCYACKKRNHFAACCNNASRINEVRKLEEGDENFDILGISTCGVTGAIGADWVVRGKIAGLDIQFKVDTGSQANLLPLSLFNRIANASTPRKSAAVLTAYNGSPIKHVGVATEDLEISETQHSVSFFIVKKGRQAILGLKACQQFGLIPVTADAVNVGDTRTEFQLAFPDLFRGTGCVKRPYKMVLREDAVPVVQPARRVPIALKGRLRQELQRMEKASIIVKVDEPTDWVSPLVVVHKKDGTLRICMDPRAVNRSIKREHYPMPSREDIESELAGAKYFSRLDANAGFHQIPLDEATSRICTFATPFGRYRFLRLPFGISSASEVFQKTLTEMFEGLPGVRVYVDDVLIWGNSKEEHDERVTAVLRRAQQEGLTFNPAKCVFCTTQVAFLGDVIGRDGIRPSPDLIESVRAMPAPKDKQGVRRLLGVVNYFRKYLPALSDKTALLRSLVKESSVFEWTTAHEHEWDQICAALTNPPLLALFDEKRNTKITADASGTGIGAALLQRHGDDWRPVTYASRALTPSEERYAHIEKETLAIVFACEKFHQFVYGRKITVETDHRPLIAIAQKNIGDMPPRLQRFFIRLMKFDFVLQFVPGKDLLLADMLSRAALPTGGSDQVEDVDVHTTQVVSSIISKATMVRLQKNTLEDPLLSRTMKQMEDGMAIDGVLKPYAEELSVVNGVILKGCKVVVPKSMRPEILERIHEGHLGMNKCKARARRLVFWPGMSSDIEQRARTCSVCRKYAYSQPSEPLLLQPTPDRPWHRVGIDLFTFAGDHYVVVFDAHSNFPDVEKLRGTTAVEVIDKISAIFSRYGIPSQVCTDNGPQFASREFALFVHRYDFEHITSSPEFPRSNGLAEKGVQIVKRILKKTHESRGDVWLGLLAYRSSPLDCGQSPGELLQGRRLHATLPEYNVDGGIPVLKQRQSSRGRPLPPLEAGNVVRIKHRNWSRRAKVVKETAPRSYVVKTEDHGLLRRNRQHLLQTDENFDGDVSDVGNGNPHPDARHPDAPRRETECSDRHRGNITQGNPLGSHQAEPANPSEDSNATSPETPGSPLAGLRRSGRQRSEPKRLHYGPSFHQVNECKSNQCFENV